MQKPEDRQRDFKIIPSRHNVHIAVMNLKQQQLLGFPKKTGPNNVMESYPAFVTIDIITEYHFLINSGIKEAIVLVCVPL